MDRSNWDNAILLHWRTHRRNTQFSFSLRFSSRTRKDIHMKTEGGKLHRKCNKQRCISLQALCPSTPQLWSSRTPRAVWAASNLRQVNLDFTHEHSPVVGAASGNPTHYCLSGSDSKRNGGVGRGNHIFLRQMIKHLNRNFSLSWLMISVIHTGWQLTNHIMFQKKLKVLIRIYNMMWPVRPPFI